MKNRQFVNGINSVSTIQLHVHAVATLKYRTFCSCYLTIAQQLIRKAYDLLTPKRTLMG